MAQRSLSGSLSQSVILVLAPEWTRSCKMGYVLSSGLVWDGPRPGGSWRMWPGEGAIAGVDFHAGESAQARIVHDLLDRSFLLANEQVTRLLR